MGDFATILDLVTKAGPYALFALTFWLLRQEREERLASQERERKLSRDMLVMMTKTTNAIRSLRYVLLHGRAPSPQEYEAEDVAD